MATPWLGMKIKVAVKDELGSKLREDLPSAWGAENLVVGANRLVRRSGSPTTGGPSGSIRISRPGLHLNQSVKISYQP